MKEYEDDIPFDGNGVINPRKSTNEEGGTQFRVNESEDLRDGPSDDEKKGFTDSMNDFTQDFLAVSWNQLGDNYVFSPFSLHSVLAMLTTGATNGSQTQKELLLGFGRNSKIDVLEKLYGQFVKDYKVK